MSVFEFLGGDEDSDAVSLFKLVVVDGQRFVKRSDLKEIFK